MVETADKKAYGVLEIYPESFEVKGVGRTKSHQFRIDKRFEIKCAYDLIQLLYKQQAYQSSDQCTCLLVFNSLNFIHRRFAHRSGCQIKSDSLCFWHF